MKECGSLQEVRNNVDRIDRQIVALLAERGDFIQQAIRFRRLAEEGPAPARIAQVIANAAALATELGANRWVVEQVFRAMTAAFISVNIEDFKARKSEEKS